MKRFYHIIILLSGLILASSCNFLDVVPDEIPQDSDAFKDKKAAERFLYSCYSYIPNPRNGTLSQDFFTADEVVTAFDHEPFSKFPKGDYTPANPTDLSYWNTLFQGIRQCYILMENIDGVPGMVKEEKELYKAEATFLIAYYHFLLIRSYGPTLLIKSLPDVEMPTEQFPERETYDECVKWVAEKFDEAVTLGLQIRHTGSAYGRATSIAALSFKARLYVYAASPQFNGGSSTVAGTDNLTSAYQNFVNSDGELLINTTYDPSKWVRAAEACSIAIKAATDNNYDLYRDSVPTTNQPLPNIPAERRVRMTFCDKYSPEIIWASTMREEGYWLQNKSTPYDPGRDWSWNGIAPTLTMIESFYTENGLPIDEDPAYVYTNRYNYTNVSDVHTNGVTSNLNIGREPRFYAWVAYHNGYYEIQRSSSENKLHTQFYKDGNCGIKSRTNNYSPTGYLNKKGVHPLYAQGSGGGGLVHYPWPFIRLAELYLNYAEALIEVGGAPNLTLAKDYIDLVRVRAGIPTLDQAWASTGKTLDQAKMRQIVRQERTIELYLENHRFWDVRRWLLGEKYFNVSPKGMTINANNEDFFTPITVQMVRKFIKPNHYLMPIPQTDTDKNIKLINNPGY